MSMHFIRHAQHLPVDNEVFYPEFGLSEAGVQESLVIRGALLDKGVVTFDRILTFDHARAVGTLAIVTATEDAPEAIDLDTLRTDPRLSFNDIYDYIPPGEEEFGTRLFESYMANKNFRFLATESDKYYRANNPISSLRYMASTVAENVLNEASDEAETLVCAREFILPSLRAALIRLNESDQSMMNYIEWYEATQEAKDAARLHISTVTPLAEEGFLITDAYSSTMHERAELVAISKELEGINAEDT